MLVQARLESRVDLQLLSLDISNILKQAFNAKEAQAVSRGITLRLVCADRAVLLGDGLLLSQALTNLIDNALDFTPIGGDVILSGTRQDHEYLIIVEDNGSGIPVYAQDKIFDRFYSLPRANSPKSTGLGLNFVREVIAIHQGSIQLENRLPQGVCARLMLPIDALERLTSLSLHITSFSFHFTLLSCSPDLKRSAYHVQICSVLETCHVTGLNFVDDDPQRDAAECHL